MRGGLWRVSVSEMLNLPDNMPRALRNGLTWMGIAWALAWGIGFEAPWDRAKNDRDEWVKAHAAATALIETQGRSILILQERDATATNERLRILQKLDEMSMVLYSLERRSR